MTSDHSRRVLVVAYYFPPMGLSGVQRVSKFVKYLPDAGWEPVVLTVEPGGYFACDEQLLSEIEDVGVEIHRTDSWDPTRLFSSGETVEMPGESVRGVFSYATDFFFIPDNKIGWKRHAIRRGRALLDSGMFDLIFSSAPPYTAHLVGAALSAESGVPLVTDFRDDWVGNPRLSFPTPFHRWRHRKLEARVLDESTHVTTINRVIKESLIQRNMDARGYTSCTIIPHGYDPEDFDAVDAVGGSADTCSFLYSGVFYDAQCPTYFLRGLARAIERRPEIRSHIRADFVGIFPDHAQTAVDEHNLEDVVYLHDYLPHREAVARLKAADVLWLIVGEQEGAQGISTSKLFEYIGSKKPILGLVPEGTARKTLADYQASRVASPSDTDAVADQILAYYDEWEAGTLPRPDERFVEQFDRRRLARQLGKLFHDLCVVE